MNSQAFLLCLLAILVGCHGQKRKAPPEPPDERHEAEPIEAPTPPAPAPPEPAPPALAEPELPQPPKPDLPIVPGTLPVPGLARVLTYRNPTATGFRLEVEPATNSSAHLRLHLVGPKGTLGQGVAFFLEVDPRIAAWGHPEGGTGVFRAGRAWPSGRSGPRLAWGKAEGGTLQVGLFRKHKTPGAMDAGPILSLALHLEAGATPGSVRFGTPPGPQAVYLDGSNNLIPMPIAVGTLVAEYPGPREAMRRSRGRAWPG